MLLFVVCAFTKLGNSIAKFIDSNTTCWFSDFSFLLLLITVFLLSGFLFYLVYLSADKQILKKMCFWLNISILLSIIVIYLSDMMWIVAEFIGENVSSNLLGNTLIDYIEEEWWIYAFLIGASFFLTLLSKKVFSRENLLKKDRELHQKKKTMMLCLFVTLSPMIFVLIPTFMNYYLFSCAKSCQFVDLSAGVKTGMNLTYFITSIGIVITALIYKSAHKINYAGLFRVIDVTGKMSAPVLAAQILFMFIPSIMMINMSLIERLDYAGYLFKLSFFSLLFNMMLLSLIYVKKHYKKKRFLDDDCNEKTTGSFGTASFANPIDIAPYYNPKNGIPTGIDEQGRTLYFPLYNKITISPPGFWKTTTSSIPVLLWHDGPVFVFDPKGEQWAVTARYRQEVLGHKVIVIDPNGVTRQPDFMKGKSESLLEKYYINPFDSVPEDPKERDRMINSFASSFIINDEGSSAHFDENAKILIRGYIDYMMTGLPKAERTLTKLYQLISESDEASSLTFHNMLKDKNSRAAAAANQIQRVGIDERGSILSTTYRQIDWMGDKNVQETLSHSNFDLSDFIKGKTDIYVVIPEDQIVEHSRLFRMIMALLKHLIVKTPPKELPEKKMLFLLEEIGQFGYTPDVEECIKILRARGIVVWTVFQSLGQIEQYKDKNLFRSMQLKQIFTNDDIDTVKWVNTIAGQKTILTKSHSTNSGDTRNKMQMFSGQLSKGEGENIHETGADLININELRELPIDEQYIFELTKKVVHCKKIQYFNNPLFKGRYDENPLESKSG